MNLPQHFDINFGETVVNANGGAQSKLFGRYDLIPYFSINKVAEILACGAEKYGENNWMKISTSDHVNHAINHLYLFLNGDTSEFHLAHAGCRVIFAIYTSAHNQ